MYTDLAVRWIYTAFGYVFNCSKDGNLSLAMNDREFVCSRPILLYFFRTGLFVKAGGGGDLLERFIYALARSFEHLG